jgi:subtilisin family serine protease
MKVTITCNNLKDADFVYDLLTIETSGNNILSGHKLCIDEHISLPDIITFDLTKEEVKEIKKLKEVNSVFINDETVKLDYEKKEIIGIPKLASYTNTFFNNNISACIPHSLYYCQNYDLSYTHEFPTNGDINNLYSLSTIDCSNIDIIVLDSGVDPTHPDFFDEFGNSRVVQFDWTQLKSGDPVNGTQIILSQSLNYYQDVDGHGTACASLAAGNKCGFAKNAKIYSLRGQGLDPTSDSFNIQQCLELMLSFQKSKKLNLYGLSANRPTIFTNSWGYVGPYIAIDLNFNDINTLNLSDSLDQGYSNYYSSLNGINSIADSYMRAIISEGVHTLVSAGNSNIYLTNNPISSINAHCFRKTFGETTYDFITVRTQQNNNSYILNQTYNSFTYGSTFGVDRQTRYFYSSPNIGLNFDKNLYPIHIVGDIIPIGYNDNDSNIFWSAGNAKAAFNILSGINQFEDRIILNDNLRYETLSGAFFIKSAYSSFGPDVDIYAPGNGTWAAMSNQIPSTSYPLITISPSERYWFFNGTSASCPIVAGILATYLSEFPNSSPKEGYDWMQANSIGGNIMETQINTLPVESFNGTTSYVINMPFGSNLSQMNIDPVYRLQRDINQLQKYNTGNINDVLFCNRFFNSKNLIAQAYPLRKAVLNTNETEITIGDAVLNRGQVVSKKITHPV